MTAKFSASADGTKVNIGNAAEDALQIDSAAKTISPVSPYVFLGVVPGGGPAFRANRGTTDQSITTNIYTKVFMDLEAFDTNNCFDMVNSRFTPTVAGYYQLNGTVYGVANAGTLVIAAANIYKNGAGYAATYIPASASTDIIVSTSCLMYLNGSTDYAELYGLVTGTSPIFKTGMTQFSAALVRPAA